MEKINHPEHYKGNKYEAIDIIDDYQLGFNLGFNLGNAVKYILRAGKKGDTAEDLKKAKWYIEHEICKLMNEKERKKEKEQVDEANVQTAIAHSEMQQVVAVYRICTALALNKLYGFGNERLKKFNEAVEESLVEFGRYAGSTGISKARGFTDLETGEEMLMQAVKSRGIDIEYALGIKALEV